MAQRTEARRIEAPGDFSARFAQHWMQDWRFPLAMCAAMLALLVVGARLGVALLPPGPWHQGGSFTHRLLSWDGIWYADVARHGYTWNPAIGELPRHYQNVDFYPLYPMIERLLMIVTRSTDPIVMLLPALIFGLWSVFAFHRLALALLPAVAAARATAIYAIWPATVYFIMGYPTGLINLFAIAALAAYIERRFWRVALWCGIGTAAAPTMVFVAVAFCLDQGLRWLSTQLPVRDIPRLIGFGLLSVSGLIAFMLYQAIAFHDPFAFIKAQEAWGTSPAFMVRLSRFLNPLWYTRLLTQAFNTFAKIYSVWRAGGAITPPLWKALQYNEQFLLNTITLILAVAGLIAAFRTVRQRIVPLAGLVVILGYLWFIATTDQNLVGTPRLFFPVLALFLGLGAIAIKARMLYPVLLALLAILTLLNGAATVSGYFLV